MMTTVISCWLGWRREVRCVSLSALAVLFLSTAAGEAETFRILHHFPTNAGPMWPVAVAPCGALVIDQGMIYGGTQMGGVSNLGTLYKVSLDGTGFTWLKEFSGIDGREPRAGLLKVGNVLYGTTHNGGLYSGGTVFKLNTDGTDFQVLHHFNPETGEGFQPAGSEPLVLAGDSLFGMTKGSGASNGVALGWGTVFRVGTNGTGFSILKNFPGDAESEPWAGLALVDNSLYGTTSGFATDNRGTVFRIGLDGSDYRVLWRFTAQADASFPLGGVVVSGNMLLGTTYYGPYGTYQGSGTVFRMNTDGTGFTRLHLFDSSGWWPREGLQLADGVLYGITIYSPSSFGGVYAITVDGAAFTMLKQFAGVDGTSPTGLTLVGRTLYGVCGGGGNYGGGVLFSLATPSPSITSNPSSQTAEVGETVTFSVKVEGVSPMTCQLFWNNTNLVASSTSLNLRLANVQISQAGVYTVRVTNAFGAATSAPADLNVILPVPRRAVPGLVLQATPPETINLDAASVLAPVQDWTPLASVQMTSPNQWFFYTNPPAMPLGLYRAWHTNLAAPPVNLDLHLVPAITLTGQPGSTVRLDYIPKFGPTGAWLTLGTIPLTESNQLYFDTSAVGQPKRLYRLTPVP
jgi:uncharacterized repeat protein (TIGR03803 family)